MIRLFKPHPLFVLIPLLIGQLALLSLQIKDSEGSTLLKRTTLQILSPLLLGASSLEKGIRYVWNEYIDVREVRNENEALKEKIQNLTLEAENNIALLRQARQWQTLLELRNRLPFQTKTAHIVGRSPSFLSFTLMIDLGTENGIQKDDPVIHVEGIIGRVINVFSKTAEVHVILDTDAAAGILLPRSQLQGVANGTGTSLLRLNYILNQEDVQIGDVVLTSGLDNIYPKDLTVGRVLRVRQGESVFKEIDVFPSVDFNRLETVLVLVNTKRQ
jgi:rod shape-determining protein MreC